jgi:hypothetical protein
MKAIRSLALAGALLSLASAASMAQSARPFQDSWFWGIKGGGTFMSSRSNSSVTSGMAGLDWLITRKRGGVYLSLDQSFLSQYATLADSVNSTDTPSVVNIKDMRRVTVAIMGYPGDWTRFHPYVGLGMVYNQVGQVKHQGSFGSSDQYALYQQIVSAYKSVFTPAIMAGGQWQVRNAAIFTQVMAWQANQQFFLSSTSHGVNASVEIGLRYNFGSSIEKER